MPKSIRCPHCSTSVHIPDNAAPGMQFRCPGCKNLFNAPGPQAPINRPAAPPSRPAGPGAPASVSPMAITPRQAVQPPVTKPSVPGVPDLAITPRPGTQNDLIPSPRNVPPGQTRPITPLPQSGAARPASPPMPASQPGTGPKPGEHETVLATYRSVLDAVSFASRAHIHHLRKDKQTPYASHVFRVCLVVRHVFGVRDPRALMAAALHDSLEDTPTDFDDIKLHFGDEVASWVATLSKDMRKEESVREREYKLALAGAPWQVQVIKLADIFDNLVDSAHLPSDQRSRTMRRSQEYMDAIKPHLNEQAQRSYEVVAQLLSEIQK